MLPYVGALDGIRALAIAGVLLYHGDVSWAPGGFLGVDVFFVLSGYLITSLLLHELTSSGRLNLRRFWLRRARRLLPAAFLLIAVCVVVATLFYVADLGRVRGDALASFLYVNNWHQILADRSYFAGFARPSSLQHLWSLAVEEQFYLLWPLALGGGLALLGRRRTALLTLVVAIGSAVEMGLLFDPGRDPSRVYFGTDTHASGLLLGALLAFAWPLGRMRADIKKGAVVVLDVAAALALAAIVAAIATWQDYDTFVYRGGLAIVAVASVVLIAAVVHPASRAGRLFALAPLRWIGQRSYGIYLWHWPVMVLTRPGIDLHWSRWLLVPAQIAVSVGLAAASYRWVEMPFRTGAAQRAIKGWLDRRRPRLRLGITTSVGVAIVAAAVAVGARDVPAPRVVELRSAAAAATPSRGGEVVPNRRPLAVGASVMLSARTELERHATVDAAVGRQPSDIINRLATYRDAGKLPDRVIVQIGENGPLDSHEERVLRYNLRGVTRVVFVNVRVPRRWNDEVNADVRALVKDWPEARLADWYKASGRSNVLYDDATHPNARGQRLYARIVQRALRRR